MELSKLKQEQKSSILLFAIIVIMYFLFTVSYSPTTSIITLPMSTQDSPYLSPEGWPLPYPYVAPPSN
jgi:hypothetical protein